MKNSRLGHRRSFRLCTVATVLLQTFTPMALSLTPAHAARAGSLVRRNSSGYVSALAKDFFAPGLQVFESFQHVVLIQASL